MLVPTAFLTLADRRAVLYAEHRAADSLKDRLRLTAAPEVEIDGSRFLPQLVRGRLDSVKVTVPDVAADRVTRAAVSATAHDIRLLGDGPTSVRGARVTRLDGDVLLSFADMNRELGASQVTFRGGGRDRVAVCGTLPVAGHELRLRAEVRVAPDGERGVDTQIGGMRLEIGDLATYRPGSRASEGLHLTPGAAAALARQTRRARAVLAVPSVAWALGVPDVTVREGAALRHRAVPSDRPPGVRTAGHAPEPPRRRPGPPRTPGPPGPGPGAARRPLAPDPPGPLRPLLPRVPAVRAAERRTAPAGRARGAGRHPGACRGLPTGGRSVDVRP
ncbi:conserved hypothetical protein [Streptomyces sviceus ATCC 29083]|uniref:Secreted protein n=1 Tax=Streptomyces sviceus (strain ATCC 29083 / DSM 924 / JCM 4929 / NBRC 13980 / NCIMB 11184 / NRRL 5439 / UC 5370) TaxID=463191 RepID=B5HLX6_STRX2|nr:conserved hypothetical protein [Streptomyces sviceus ATCC 29083]